MAVNICLGCSDPISDENESVSCSGSCCRQFHYRCVGISDKNFRKLKSGQSSDLWKCIACTHDPALGVSSGITEIRDKPATSDPSKHQDLIAYIKEENRSLKDYIKYQFEEYEKNLEFNSSLIKDLSTQFTVLTSEVKDLKVRNAELKRENGQIKDELKQAQLEIADLQQYSRRANLEITNLPESESENINEVLTSVFSCLEVNLMDQVSIAHRVPTSRKDKPKPVIVQFINKQHRDTCLKAARTKKINASQVNERHKNEPIYFNEHLTPRLKELFFHCRKFKEANNYKFAWVKDGKIFIRENENSKVIRIVSTDELINLNASRQ